MKYIYIYISVETQQSSYNIYICLSIYIFIYLSIYRSILYLPDIFTQLTTHLLVKSPCLKELIPNLCNPYSSVYANKSCIQLGGKDGKSAWISQLILEQERVCNKGDGGEKTSGIRWKKSEKKEQNLRQGTKEKIAIF